MLENALYLTASILLSSSRNLLSKKTALTSNKASLFFLLQTILFLSSTLIVLVFGRVTFIGVATQTFVYGVIYGVLLILSQWMLTLSLRVGNVGVCTVIYSLGFLLPTLSGAVFFNETFTLINGVGLVLAVAVILLNVKKQKSAQTDKKHFTYLIIIAMLSSGGLGIMQKVQQNSFAKHQKGTFLFVAFTFAFLFSLLFYLFSKNKTAPELKTVLVSLSTGLCFGGANFCNTFLAGRMSSAVFFPLQNISTIVVSAVLGIIIFKEKITPKTAITILLGVAVILFFIK